MSNLIGCYRRISSRKLLEVNLVVRLSNAELYVSFLILLLVVFSYDVAIVRDVINFWSWNFPAGMLMDLLLGLSMCKDIESMLTSTRYLSY